MKILIAINDNNGINSKLSEHFGHCPYFAIYETDNKSLEIVENKLDHSNQNQTPVDQIMKFNPTIVFTLGIGARAIKLFNEKGIKLKTGNYQIVKEVIENIENLKEMDSGCEH
ncbi:NifB/NifX family molybdenum-iron cluster-binding protein [Candidatus Pacearchaeota archaeon]|nr:NifB/NifX family molybdenum-iron cluster-binding protein [Candidatus Pacearchaeota archaeon]